MHAEDAENAEAEHQRYKRMASLAHASRRGAILVLGRTQMDWRVVKHLIAPYLRNNAGWKDLVRMTL